MEMQLRSPVRGAACVGSLVDLGCDMFIEVGPKRALTGMMRELVPGAAAVAVGTAAAPGTNSRIIPVNARLGPTSMNMSQPRSTSDPTHAAHRTGDLSCISM